MRKSSKKWRRIDTSRSKAGRRKMFPALFAKSPARKARIAAAASPAAKAQAEFAPSTKIAHSNVLTSPVRNFKEQPKARKATASEQEQGPTIQPTSSKTGKTGKGPTIIPPMGLAYKHGIARFKGVFTKGTTLFEDKEQPPRPIRTEFIAEQFKTNRKLDEWKKQYGRTSMELDVFNLTVGWTGPYKENRIFNKTCAGYGKSNLHWPYSWLDHASNYKNPCKTSTHACFTRSQLYDFLIKQIEQQVAPGPVDEAMLDQLLNPPGDTRTFFPFDEVECTYTYTNNNTSLPMYCSLYICQPKRNLPAKNSPLFDWFEPWTSAADTDNRKMPARYRYDPVVTSQKGMMYTVPNGTQPVVTETEGFINNANAAILTQSTEVVAEASPDGFSQRYREHWDTLTVRPFRLEPQQSLEVTLRVSLRDMLDVREFVRKSPVGETLPEYFEGLTLFPMLKYYGEETVGISQNLVRNDLSSYSNRVMEQTAARSGPVMVSEKMTCKVSAHIAANKPGPINQAWANWFNNLTATTRSLLDWNDPERGALADYHQVNDFVGLYINEASIPTEFDPPSSSTPNPKFGFIETLARIETHDVSIPVSTAPVPTQVKPANTRPRLGTGASPDGDWDVLELRTVSRTTTQELKSEISVNP